MSIEDEEECLEKVNQLKAEVELKQIFIEELLILKEGREVSVVT